MTNFVGLIIGPDMDGQLARYDENLEVDRYKDRVDPAPAGWQTSVANRAEFARLLDTGLDRKVAWKQVWGEENTDPDLPWPRFAVLRDGVDPTDDAAVAAWTTSAWGSEEGYLVDEEGLFQWSTCNPDGKWDWHAEPGQWPDFLNLTNGEVANAAPASSINWDATFTNAGYRPSVIVAGGVWRQSKSWGMFGTSRPTEHADDWDEWTDRFLRSLGDLTVTVVDFHT